jgi:hypothetical protein
MSYRKDSTLGCRFTSESVDFSPSFWLASLPSGQPIHPGAKGHTATFTALFMAYPLLIAASLLLAFLVERNLFSPI